MKWLGRKSFCATSNPCANNGNLPFYLLPPTPVSQQQDRVAQWLRCCATFRKIPGSIPAGVSGFFIDIKSFRSHYGPGVDSASNRNVYQEHFLGVKAAGA